MELVKVKISISFLKTLLLCTLCFGKFYAFADDKTCSQVKKDIKLASSLASASTWSNMRGGAGSLNAESKRLIADAWKNAGTNQAPANLCPKTCSSGLSPQVILVTTPNKTLASYSEQAACRQKLAETQKKPLLYPDRRFATLDELNSWFSSFSQGSGTDGKDLYTKCDGSCSPRYESVITKEAAGYRVTTSVICGEARDKDDNQYALTSSIRWGCQAGS